MTAYTNAKLVLPDGIYEGSLIVENDLIREVLPGVTLPDAVDLGGLYLAPGFIEMHTHGAGGYDFMDGTKEAFIGACMTHFAHGTTTILPTTVAATRKEILRATETCRAIKADWKDGPYVHGMHMEGPYLNPIHKGAIDETYIRNPDPNEYEEFLAAGKGCIARWTLAPELDGAPQFAKRLREEGILPSMGHTNAEYSQVVAAAEQGCTHLTHMYSCMSTIVRKFGFRFPGVIESAFILDDLTVELIADGCHLPPEMLKMVHKCLGVDRVALVCDSIRCAGQDVTEAIIGSTENGYRVLIEDGVAKLCDRSAFAGSVATDDRLVRTMHTLAGVPLCDCVRMMTLTPAKILGIDDVTGSLQAGKRADLVCFDEDIRIKGVCAAGHGRIGLLA